jgi:protein-S-isoprenylcysteine O-methyltransferase Ste14
MMTSKPGTIIPPPVPFATAIGGGWYLDRHVLTQPLDLGPLNLPLALVTLFAGLSLMTWAIWVFQKHQTTVNPYAGAKRLCTAGPFQYSRNPIYVGDWLILAGSSVGLHTLWPVWLAPIVWAGIRYGVIRHEEAHLLSRFGEEYRAYQARVRRWL